MDNEKIKGIEEQAVIKYEKGAKPYRAPKYKPTVQQIKCEKCGSSYNLMKYTDKNTGRDFWFCKACVVERAKEIQREKKVG